MYGIGHTIHKPTLFDINISLTPTEPDIFNKLKVLYTCISIFYITKVNELVPIYQNIIASAIIHSAMTINQLSSTINLKLVINTTNIIVIQIVITQARLAIIHNIV